MRSVKRLNSVAHGIAHHSVTALSHLHPHLGQACSDANKEEVTIDLLADPPYPDWFQCRKPLAIGLATLKETFQTMLQAEHFPIADVTDAFLIFHFDNKYGDWQYASCEATITSAQGEVFKRSIDFTGEIEHPA